MAGRDRRAQSNQTRVDNSTECREHRKQAAAAGEPSQTPNAGRSRTQSKPVRTRSSVLVVQSNVSVPQADAAAADSEQTKRLLQDRITQVWLVSVCVAASV